RLVLRQSRPERITSGDENWPCLGHRSYVLFPGGSQFELWLRPTPAPRRTRARQKIPVRSKSKTAPPLQLGRVVVWLDLSAFQIYPQTAAEAWAPRNLLVKSI